MSAFLIQDKFIEFDFDFYQSQKTNIIDKINNLRFTDEYFNNLIEEIDDSNYNLCEQEIKYKIFEDISSVSKKNNMLELVLNIPVDNNILSINKIKLSNKLNKYINDIYICIGDEKVITHTDFINKKYSQHSSKFIEYLSCDKIINCENNKNITLHILLDSSVINKIINKNIFVNYSFAIYKNKQKFL